LHGWRSDPELARRVERRVDDRLGDRLGLINGADRLMAASHVRARPAELRRVHAGEMHHGEPDLAAVMQELASERVREAAKRRFGSAVGCLKRDRAIGERGPYLHDRASVDGPHMTQRGQRSVNRAEIRDLGHAPPLFGRNAVGGPEDGRHRVVDPHVEPAPPRDELSSRGEDRIGIGHVDRDHHGPAAGSLDVAAGTRQPGMTAGQKGYTPATARKGDGGRSADAC
jgi:hypothetical protein